MMIRSWCRRRARGVVAAPARAASPAPALEWLEDRCVPATGLSPLSAGGLVLSAPPGHSFTAPVAHLRLAGATGVQAVIDWGDGQTSAGTLRADGGPDFDVLGTTTYQHPGVFTVSVSVTADGGVALTVTTEVVVAADSPEWAVVISSSAGGGADLPGDFVIVTPAPSDADEHVPAQPAPVPAGTAPPPPSGKLTTAAGSGATALLPAANAPRPRPAAAAATPPRPVDPTTFVIWTSQRDQGGTLPQAQPSFVLTTDMTTGLGGAAEPARLDVEAFFMTRQAEEDVPAAPRPVPAEGATSLVVAAAGPGREWLWDDTVIAALADATRAPAAVAAAPPVLPAEAGPGAAVEECAGRDESSEKGRLLPRAAAWLVVTRLVCGLCSHWGRPGAPTVEPALRSRSSRH